MLGKQREKRNSTGYEGLYLDVDMLIFVPFNIPYTAGVTDLTDTTHRMPALPVDGMLWVSTTISL